MVAKVSGTFMVEMLGKTVPFVLANGKLTVEGKPFELKPSDDKAHPVASGWFQYAPDSFIQITSTGIEVKAKVGGKPLPITVKKPSGTFMVEIEGSPATFVLKEGKLTVEGESVALKPSAKKEYPATAGWFEYKTDSFIQISASANIKADATVKANSKIEVAVLKGNNKVPVEVKEPEPVPADSKYLHVREFHIKCSHLGTYVKLHSNRLLNIASNPYQANI